MFLTSATLSQCSLSCVTSSPDFSLHHFLRDSVPRASGDCLFTDLWQICTFGHCSVEKSVPSPTGFLAQTSSSGYWAGSAWSLLPPIPDSPIIPLFWCPTAQTFHWLRFETRLLLNASLSLAVPWPPDHFSALVHLLLFCPRAARVILLERESGTRRHGTHCNPSTSRSKQEDEDYKTNLDWIPRLRLVWSTQGSSFRNRETKQQQ